VVASLAQVVSIPTASGTRSVVTLHPAIASRYARIVAPTVPLIEAGLSPRVVANRVASVSTTPASIVLRPWRVERRGYARLVRTLAPPGDRLVLADVRACYSSIAPSVAERRLRSLGVGAPQASAVARFLEWLGDRADVAGLPIGPAPSAVLANAVLAEVDERLDVAGRRFVRWVDDVVVGVSSPDDASAVLELIDEALQRVGLDRNDAKTRFADVRDGHGSPSEIGPRS
jgi:hypothetical protein